MKRAVVLPAMLAILILAFVVWAFIPSGVKAAVPQLINFQGILKDGSGNPVANGPYSVIFTIYDAPAGGSVQWAETTSVTTTSGLFTVLLGALNPVPDSAYQDTTRYLGIKIGADPEMTPRQQLVSVGYGYRVNSVDGASGGDILGDLSVSGILQTNGLNMPTGAASGLILTSNASGVGTWQPASSQSNPWFVGGDLGDLFAGSGKLAAYPPEQYEYGFKAVDEIIHEAMCKKWDAGLIFYNRFPIFIFAADPSASMKWGGSMFYIGTSASDDDGATPTAWKHRYWTTEFSDLLNGIRPEATSFGFISISVYCRKR